MIRSLTTLLCISLMVAALTACGKKGPVRPKLLPLPAAPVGLTLEQRGSGFLLSWGIPERNQDGSPLTDLQGFRVERMTYHPLDDCPECREDFQETAELDLEYLRQAVRLGNRIFWRDAEPAPGLGYRYRVVPVTTRGQFGAAARAMRPFLPPPPPPRQITASSHDRMVRLDWQAPAEPTGEIVGYRVYRRRPGEPPPLLPAFDRPPAPPLDDFGLENGQVYLYSVATLIEIRGAVAESDPSGEIEAAPQEGR